MYVHLLNIKYIHMSVAFTRHQEDPTKPKTKSESIHTSRGDGKPYQAMLSTP